MHSVVSYILAVESRLIFEVLVELLVDIILDRLKAVITIERIAITGSVHNSDPQFDALFDYIQLFLIDSDCPLEKFVHIWNFAVFVEIGQKETVDKSGLP